MLEGRLAGGPGLSALGLQAGSRTFLGLGLAWDRKTGHVCATEGLERVPNDKAVRVTCHDNRVCASNHIFLGREIPRGAFS